MDLCKIFPMYTPGEVEEMRKDALEGLTSQNAFPPEDHYKRVWKPLYRKWDTLARKKGLGKSPVGSCALIHMKEVIRER